MGSFLLKFTLVLNSVLFWKLLVFEFLLGISDFCLIDVCSSRKNCPSARCESAANVSGDADVCGAKYAFLNHI
jgi:hypothetical protein